MLNHRSAFYAIFAIVMLFGCSKQVALENTQIEISSILFKDDSLSIKEGEKISLRIDHLPSNAKVPDLEWSSSRPDVVSIDNEGVAHAESIGESIITAKVKNSSVRTKILIKVVFGPNSIIPVKSINFENDSVSIEEESQKKLVLKHLPDSAQSPKVVWTSSNRDIVEIDTTGVVYGKSMGKAVISARVFETEITTSILVKVIPGPNSVIPVNSISFHKFSDNAVIKGTYQIKATVLPENATNKTLTWKSSDTNIATVDADGLVKSLKAGSVKISATSSDGSNSASFDIHFIIPSIDYITFEEMLSKDESETPQTGDRDAIAKAGMIIGERATITAKVLPEDAHDKTVTWSTSNSNLAAVSDVGTITAYSLGTLSIKATSKSNPNISRDLILKIANNVSDLVEFSTASEFTQDNEGFVKGGIILQTSSYRRFNSDKLSIEKIELLDENQKFIAETFVNADLNSSAYRTSRMHISLNSSRPVKLPKYVKAHFRFGSTGFVKQGTL